MLIKDVVQIPLACVFYIENGPGEILGPSCK